MSIENKITALSQLGAYIKEDGDALNEAKLKAKAQNPWFTLDNINFSLSSIATEMLDADILKEWTSNYKIGRYPSKKVGLILAGNIPLVGFHDILSVYLSGNELMVKNSAKDSILTKHLISVLSGIENNELKLNFVERLQGMEAVIATGSNQSAKQFAGYFSKYPNIIRRNRNGVAVLSGQESKEEILKLGKDIYQYFGLGCRNVSKIYIPQDFDKPRLLEILHDEYKYLINHTKYKNNYDYNYALYLLNAEDFLANGSLILRRSNDIISRISCLHFEEYSDQMKLITHLTGLKDEIQVISSSLDLNPLQSVALGNCQKPEIDDYADGIDTMEFLTSLQ